MDPPVHLGTGSEPELYSYKLKNATQTITIKSKVGSALMALSLYKVEVGHSKKSTQSGVKPPQKNWKTK